MVLHVFSIKMAGDAAGQALGAIADGGDVARHLAMRHGGGVAKTMDALQPRATARVLGLEFEGRPEVGHAGQLFVLIARRRLVAVRPQLEVRGDGRQLGALSQGHPKACAKNHKVHAVLGLGRGQPQPLRCVTHRQQRAAQMHVGLGMAKHAQ